MRQYHFYSSPVRAAGVHVVGVGRLRLSKKKWVSHQRALGSYNISFIRRGRALFESKAAGRLVAETGDCLVFFPGQPYVYQPVANGPWDEWWFQFVGPVPQALENAGEISPARPLYRPADVGEIERLFKRALGIADKGGPAQIRGLPCLAYRILNEVLLGSGDVPRNRNMPMDPLEAIPYKIRQHPERNWDFRALCREHGISHPALFKGFRKEYKTSPHRFLNRERMKIAVQCLTSGMKVSETCFQVGFKDPYHFSRLFKQVIGRPPSAFQQTRKTSVDLT